MTSFHVYSVSFKEHGDSEQLNYLAKAMDLSNFVKHNVLKFAGFHSVDSSSYLD